MQTPSTEANKPAPSYQTGIPVLLLTFNRPDTTQLVLSEIRKAKPPRIYVSSDGARSTHTREASDVQSVRRSVLASIDWDCEVKTLFNTQNLGCKKAVSNAISWFFEHEPYGIILEDDCLPNGSFFSFCEKLLERYKDDQRVMHISGANLQGDYTDGVSDYHFSKYANIWGWATWADRWQHYDPDLNNVNLSDFVSDINFLPEELRYWTDIFTRTKANRINTWDYQWIFTIWRKSGLSVTPRRNMVSNIGFRNDATHTTAENHLSNLPRHDLPLRHHPASIDCDNEADRHAWKTVFRKRKKWERLRDLLARKLRYSIMQK